MEFDGNVVTEQDLGFLRRTFELALRARGEGRHPFGALIVNEQGETLVEARNNALRPGGEATQHAERLACSLAGRKYTDAELARCTLYASTEPCAMCAGAIYWVGIGRVVYALPEQALLGFTKGSAANPTLDLPCREVFARGQRQVVVAGPALEEEAGAVHAGFWETRLV